MQHITEKNIYESIIKNKNVNASYCGNYFVCTYIYEISHALLKYDPRVNFELFFLPEHIFVAKVPTTLYLERKQIIARQYK